MSRDYIPSSNSDFNTFQEDLNTEVTPNAAAWNIPAAEVTALNNWSVGYQLVYKPITNARTRTREQLIAHDEYRKDYVAFLRPFVQGFLANNILIPISQRAAMGLNPRGLKPRSKRPQIETAPIPTLKAMGGGMVQFSFKVEDSNIKRGRHPESNGVEVYYRLEAQYKEPAPVNDVLVEEAVPAPKASVDYKQRFSTRAQYLEELGKDAIGQRLTVYARWVNTSDPEKNGPFSATTSTVIS